MMTHAPAVRDVPQRFYSLDVLRGIAALSVVFWHWQHFFFEGTRKPPVTLEALPFYDVFFALYSKGWLGVDLFFCLSGFIFYWLYSAAVASAAVSAHRRARALAPWLAAALWMLAVVLAPGAGQSYLGARLMHLYAAALLFPLTVLTLALVETRRGHLMRRASILGDISYSSYLLRRHALKGS